MGHRHTSQGQRGHGSVSLAEDGASQAPEEFVMPVGAAASANGTAAGDGTGSAGRPYSFAVRLALFALRCYQAYLSVLFAGSCRFEPTCSQYAYQAIEAFGLPRGVWLGAKRLLRCHPFSGKFGYDPVPGIPPDGQERPVTNHAAVGHVVGRSAPVKDGIRL